MSTATSIQWTDATWNPLRGCTPVSPGCLNCYAMKQAHRFSGPGGAYEGLTKLTTKGPRWTGAIRLVPEALEEPLRWRKPRRVFVNSMSDLFHEDVPDVFIDRVFLVMARARMHTFQILTKRPARMADYRIRLCSIATREWTAARLLEMFPGELFSVAAIDWISSALHRRTSSPLPNVWLGTSVEDQQRADERIPHLLRTPAALRFLSCEPLLGPLDLRPFDWLVPPNPDPLPLDGNFRIKGIYWVIVGGESGPGARPFNIAWAESIIEQCRAAAAPCFVKQLGRLPYKQELGDPKSKRIRLSDSKGGVWDEWPHHLRVREFPEAAPV